MMSRLTAIGHITVQGLSVTMYSAPHVIAIPGQSLMSVNALLCVVVGDSPVTTVCLCVGSRTVEQVLQKFEARPSNSEPQVRTAEVGAAGKARERYERSDEAITDCGTDDHVVSSRQLPSSSAYDAFLPRSIEFFLNCRRNWRTLCGCAVDRMVRPAGSVGQQILV